MRPKIPEPLRERAEAVVDVGGYASVGELVRGAVRSHVAELERQDMKIQIATDLSDEVGPYEVAPEDLELVPVEEDDGDA